MASPRSVSSRDLTSPVRRYRRSSFNGSKQLSAAQAPTRRVLILLGMLVLGLVAALAVIVGVHLQNSSEPTAVPLVPATATHPASH